MKESNNYHLLANAIIVQAVDDYIDCSTGFSLEKGISKAECKKFFRSDWFMMLSNVDGEKIIQICDMIASKMKKLQFDYKRDKKKYVVFNTDTPDVIIAIFDTTKEARADAADRQGLPIKYYSKCRKRVKKAGNSHGSGKKL